VPAGAAVRGRQHRPTRALCDPKQLVGIHRWIEQLTNAQADKTLWAPALNHAQCEALEQIATKLARLLTGDPNHADHARDIAGYAELLARRGENGPT
jgi:hypothetical protein